MKKKVEYVDEVITEEEISKDVKRAIRKHRVKHHNLVSQYLTFFTIFIAWIYITVWIPQKYMVLRYVSIFLGISLLLFISSFISKQKHIEKHSWEK